MAEIVFASTIELASGIRSGRYSAAEVLEAHLKQMETHNSALNAVVTLDAERAKARAREADRAMARGEVWGPLHGVPFTLKDAFATAGIRTTSGFPPLANYVPQTDSTVAARLKAAGGILMGKTNVFEMLGDFAQTINPIFGRTNNPWNIERVPGGSSGGAAAAVASGMTPFEIGTDLAGSIRIPAHYCGLFGLKPTEKRVSLTGLLPGLDSPRGVRIMSCVGPLARTVEDLALLFAIIAGPDGQDTEVPPVPVPSLQEVGLKKLRIAFSPTFPGFPVSSDNRKAIEELAAQLDQVGVIVEEATLPELNFGQELARAGELIGMITGVFQPGAKEQQTLLAHYFELLDLRDHSISIWDQFFQSWDVLLSPPDAVGAFPHCEPGMPLAVDGHEMSYWMVNAHSMLFNYSGNPAVVLPYQLDRDGLPVGVQLVGRRWEESRLLAIARSLAEVTGKFNPPPGYGG